MFHLGPVLVSFVLSLVSPAARSIDRAFLDGEAAVLASLIRPGSYINVSFSRPVAFSDLLSREQAVLWFRKLFRIHRTTGFYPDVPHLEHGAVIYKARWEVETPDRRTLAFDVFFLLRLKFSGASPPAGASGSCFLLQVRAEQR
ncbi:MAG: hypothetical protein JW843_04350 [Candidatus Aminicenantes bacterium]|nr:hypothetical protein [Candidatus Aminicenantes bacterium]